MSLAKSINYLLTLAGKILKTFLSQMLPNFFYQTVNRVSLVFCLIAEKLQTGVLKENYLKGLGLNIRIQKTSAGIKASI